MIPIADCEPIEIPEGILLVGHCDKKSCEGYLLLQPGKALDTHSRPVDEKLQQMKGESVIAIDNHKLPLRTKDIIMITANKEHQHRNDSKNVSITHWYFNGDITKIIEEVKG